MSNKTNLTRDRRQKAMSSTSTIPEVQQETIHGVMAKMADDTNRLGPHHCGQEITKLLAEQPHLKEMVDYYLGIQNQHLQVANDSPTANLIANTTYLIMYLWHKSILTAIEARDLERSDDPRCPDEINKPNKPDKTTANPNDQPNPPEKRELL